MRPLLLSLSLVTVVLAGCTSEEGDGAEVTQDDCFAIGKVLGEDAEGNPVCLEPPFEVKDFEDPDHYCVVNKQEDRLHAPDLVGTPWELGQYWDYDLSLDGAPANTTRLIYYADQEVGADLPLHYMVGTPTRQEALVHAMDSINPVIGRIHSVLYSPHESGDHADMFHFPLCEGSSWSTVFYGETFSLTATKDELMIAGFTGARPGYTIQGTSAEGSTLRLTYSPDVKWFTEIDLDRADGQTVDMILTATGDGATGETFFLRGQKDESLDFSRSAPAVVANDQQSIGREDGGAGPYDTVAVRMNLQVTGGTGQMELQLHNPAGETVATLSTADGDGALELLEEFDFEVGQWEVSLQGAVTGGPESNVDVKATVTMVSIYDLSCTVGATCEF